MFEEFKAKHGGLGPAQFGLDIVSGGALSSRVQRQAVGQQMDDTLASITADASLPADFKDQASKLLTHGVYSVDQALKNVAAVRAEAHQQHTLAEGFAPVLAGLDSLDGNAATPEDKAILSTLRANAEAATKFAADPATRERGLSMFDEVAKNVAAFTTTAKANKITADTAEAQAKRDLGNDRFTHFNTIQNDWQSQSTSFRVIQNAWRSVQDLAGIKSPTPETDQLLVKALGQIFNPGVAVRPGEDPGDQYFGALDGIAKGLGAAAKYVFTGGAGMDDATRDKLLYAAAQRVKQENEAQTGRNTEALALGKAAQLPPEYLDRLSVAPIDLGDAGSATPPNSKLELPKRPTSSSSSPPADAVTDEQRAGQGTEAVPGLPLGTIAPQAGFESVPSLTQWDRVRRVWDDTLQRQPNETLDAYEARIAARHKKPTAVASTDEFTAGGF